MRKLMLVFVLVLVIGALPVAAQTCDRVINSRSYDDGQSASWCWLSSMICYYCWGSNPDEHCARNWEPCNPAPPKKGPEPIVVDARPLSMVAPNARQKRSSRPRR